MDILEEDLKNLCMIAPHWQQLLLQGFWYGLISWTTTCAEEKRSPKEHPLTLKEIVMHSDAEFETWPLEWLESWLTRFLDLGLSEEQLNKWFETLDTLFRDTIPTDLDIFSTLAEGETLTEQQWSRLHDALAFIPTDHSGYKKPKNRNKTRRLHGRRAITPMKRRHHHRAVTYHKHHQQTISVIKMK